MKFIAEVGAHRSIHKLLCEEMVNTVGQEPLTKSNRWRVP